MLAHVDMDAFYASVEVLDRPELAGRPVIVGGGKRGVVSAASYAARAFGVRSAMPMFEARRRCPGGVFLPVRMERYQQVSRRVMAVLGRFSPLVEPVSVDEAYLDLTGTEGLWGPPAKAGRAIKQGIKSGCGLTCSVGIAPRRFLAKIASDRDKPDGLTVVDNLEGFLATVTLKEVPGVGPKAQARLAQIGVTMLTGVRALGQKRLERMFGSWGIRLWELAHGVDPSGVSPGREVKSISHERTLETDTGDRARLEAMLLDLCQKVATRLRRRGLSARTVTLKLRHADLRLVTRSRTLPAPTWDTAEVFDAARALLRAYQPPGPFRLIGAGVSGLAPAGSGEAELFGRERKNRRKALFAAEDAITARFGDRALVRAGVLDRDDDNGHNEDEPQQ